MVDGKSSSVWSVEEDAELARLQEIHGNRWALVAAELPGKTGQQCAQRWRHKVNPAIKKEKWTPEEDAQLARLYEEHGQRWAEIARHLEGRTDQQCMGRWRRHLDPSVKKDAWCDAEDGQLMTLHDTLGPRWSNISKMLTGRTAQQCRARWFQLSATEDDGEYSEEGGMTSSGDSPTAPAAAAGAGGGASSRKNNASSAAEKASALGGSGVGKRGGGGSGGGGGSPPLSPSTPALTDETQQGGAVAGGGVGTGAGAGGAITGGGGGGTSKKRAAQNQNGAGGGAAVNSKRRKTLKDTVGGANKGGGGGGGGGASSAAGWSSSSSAAAGKPKNDGFGNAGGLDMLAMLYSAAVTFEQGFAGSTGDSSGGGSGGSLGGVAGSAAAGGMPAELHAQ